MAKTAAIYPVYGGNGITGHYDKYNVKSNTIIIGRVGFYCGSIHVTYSDAWITDNALIVEYDTNNLYLYFLSKVLCEKELGKKSSSTAQPLVTGKIIKPLIVAIPPLNEQKRIVIKLNEILDKLKDEN